MNIEKLYCGRKGCCNDERKTIAYGIVLYIYYVILKGSCLVNMLHCNTCVIIVTEPTEASIVGESIDFGTSSGMDTIETCKGERRHSMVVDRADGDASVPTIDACLDEDVSHEDERLEVMGGHVPHQTHI